MAWTKAARDAAARTRKMHAKAIERTTLSKETRNAGAAALKLARKKMSSYSSQFSIKERNEYAVNYAAPLLGRKTKKLR